MPNLYDRPAQAQFINTYDPLPFNEIVQAGLARQGRYDTNLGAQEQAIADLESIRAIPGADTDYVRKAADTMREIAEEYADKDYSNTEVVREIAKKVRRGGVDRRTLSDIQGTYSAAKEYQKLALQAGTPKEWQEDFSQYSSEARGVFSGMPEKPLDTEGAFREAFANVGEGSLGYTMDFGGGRKANMWGKSEKKLKQHILDNYERLAQDPRISQFIRRSGVDPNNHEEAKKLLLSEAPKYVEEKPYFYQEPKNKTLKYGESDFAEATSLAGVSDKSKQIKRNTLKYDDLITKGKVGEGLVDPKTGKKAKWYDKLAMTYGPHMYILKKITDTMPESWQESFNKAYDSDYVDKLKRMEAREGEFPDTEEGRRERNLNLALEERAKTYLDVDDKTFNNMSDKKRKDLIDEYLFDYQTEAREVPLNQLTPDQAEYMNEQYFAKDKKGNILAESAEWYDPENPSRFVGNKGTSFKEVTKEYPMKQSTTDDNGYDYFVTHQLSNPLNHIFSSGYRVDISKGGTTEKTFYMSSPGGKRDQLDSMHQLYKMMYANPTGIVNHKLPPIEIGDKTLSNVSIVGQMVSDGVGTLRIMKDDKQIGALETDYNAHPTKLMEDIKNQIKFYIQYNK